MRRTTGRVLRTSISGMAVVAVFLTVAGSRPATAATTVFVSTLKAANGHVIAKGRASSMAMAHAETIVATGPKSSVIYKGPNAGTVTLAYKTTSVNASIFTAITRSVAAHRQISSLVIKAVMKGVCSAKWVFQPVYVEKFQSTQTSHGTVVTHAAFAYRSSSRVHC